MVPDRESFGDCCSLGWHFVALLRARLDGLGKRADREDLIRPKSFNVRLWNRHHSDRLAEGIEDLQHAAPFASLRMRDVVHQDCHVSPSEVVLGMIALQSDMLVEGQAHDFSFRGFNVTKRV
jgi:hypothetical protein